MSAIRPLATIAVLMVLGFFLWNQINTPGLKETTESELALEGAPELSLDLDLADTLEGSPPQFDASVATGGAASEIESVEFDFAPSDPAQPGSIEPLDASATAAMPELPPLPAEVPTADYSTEAAGSDTAATPPIAVGTVTGAVPSLGTQVPPATETSPVPPPPATTMAESDTAASAVPESQPAAAAASDMLSQVGESAIAAEAAQEFASEASAFAAARPSIQAALERGELGRAHTLLSGWYGDRSLTVEESQEVDNLLAQLAGTVIYSAEHRLEPPHLVQPGETLETIAQTYNVPWQLLAKINGVAQPSSVAVGQELKVIRGPFSAVVDVERQQLALMVADRYAGRFSVKTEGQAAGEGEWVVTQKQMPSGAELTAKQLMLGPMGTATGGPQLVLGPTTDNSPQTAGAIRVGPSDQEDLFDILSIGSRVIIRK